MITHDTVLAFVDWALRHFGAKPGDRISGHPPLHFDLSTFDIYATLAAGAELHLVPASLGIDPRGTASFIRDRALTQWFSVPSRADLPRAFDAVAQDDFPALERLLWCGEVLPTPVLAHWMRRLPHVRFTNLYGPTEATIASAATTTCPRSPPTRPLPVPIGRACEGEELLVLDEAMAPVPAGEIGELYIGGVGLSPGYWRDPEKTAAAFRADPVAGERASTAPATWRAPTSTASCTSSGAPTRRSRAAGTASSSARSRPRWPRVAGVRECAVVGVDTGGFEGTTICCAYSVAEGHELPPTELRSAVAELAARATWCPRGGPSSTTCPTTSTGRSTARRCGSASPPPAPRQEDADHAGRQHRSGERPADRPGA